MYQDEKIVSVDSFVFYRTFIQSARLILNEEEQLQFLNSVIDYALDGKRIEESDVDKKVFALFNMIYKNIEKNNERRINGSKGGRKAKPKGSEETLSVGSLEEVTSGYKEKEPNGSDDSLADRYPF